MAKSKVWEPILSRPGLHRAKPLKQLLAIMLVFTVAIVLNSDVLNSDVAWHRVVQ
jgi:hypothetical protein